MTMTALEQELLRYLADRLANEFGDHVEQHLSAKGDASSRQYGKPLHFELNFELRSWDKVDGDWRAPVICRDVLDVYRKLPAGLTEGRPMMLAVHGELGAGKSFIMGQLFCGLAREVLLQPDNHTLHVPLMLRLAQWTRPGESFSEFLARHWREGGYDLLARDWRGLRGQRPLLLLLDGLDEMPDALNREKNDFLYDEVESQEAISAWAGLIACETAPAAQSMSAMNTLELLPLPMPACTPTGPRGKPPRFMRLPYWRSMRDRLQRDLGPRHDTRLELVEAYLADCHGHGQRLYHLSHSAEQVPQLQVWTKALRALALTLVLPQGQAKWQYDHRQHIYASQSVLCEAPTGMTRTQVDGQLPPAMLEFSLQVGVLHQGMGLYFFQHQLLQEVLAAGSLLSAWAADPQGAQAYWPAQRWWRCMGWERVAMIAAELLDGDVAAVNHFVLWLAQAQPEVALLAWHAAGRPLLESELQAWIRERWQPGMTDPVQWPAPAARATIGRAMAGFDLDDRPGIGLRPDGLPDIDWVEFSDGLPFIYQGAEHPELPPFAISRYPITVRQYQAFVDAPDGHVDERWWHGIEQWQYQSFFAVPDETSTPGEWRRYQEIPRGILQPEIPDTNCPRSDVTWYQATAYCRWLSHRLGQEISLPTERQWERVARGRHGWRYPSSPHDYPAGHMNCNDPDLEDSCCSGTSAVGIFPQGATPEGGVHDMAGNVSEWCLDAVECPVSDPDWASSEWRPMRGGNWSCRPTSQDCVARGSQAAEVWSPEYGFRICQRISDTAAPAN